MNEVVIWSCQANDGQQPTTVGQKWTLVCDGAPKQLNKETLSLSLPENAKDPNQKYALRLLGVSELTESKATLVVTSYLPGEGELTDVKLTDGTNHVLLHGVRVRVSSSIDKKENPEGKPFPPYGVIGLAWPLWMWLVLGAFALSLVAYALLRWRRKLQKKKLLAEIAAHGIALSPYNQFNKEMRLLGRKYPVVAGKEWSAQTTAQFVNELNQSFRWFLARQCLVPALQWGPRQIIFEIKKQDKNLAKLIEKDLRLLLNELSKATGGNEQLSAIDGQQLNDLCRKMADQLNAASSVRQKGGK